MHEKTQQMQLYLNKLFTSTLNNIMLQLIQPPVAIRMHVSDVPKQGISCKVAKMFIDKLNGDPSTDCASLTFLSGPGSLWHGTHQ